MPRKEIIVDFSEIFHFAGKEPYNLSWNKCCDIFHSNTEMLSSPEVKNCHLYLSDMEGDLKYMQSEKYNALPYASRGEKFKEEILRYTVLIDFMKQHNIEECIVNND